MLRYRRVPAIAGSTHMGGDPLALVEQLDRARRDPRLDRLTREAVGDRVVMALDLDMIVKPGAPPPPFGEHIGLQRQRLQGRSVDRLEQLTAGLADAAHDPAIVEIDEQLADRGIEFGKAVKDPVAQPPEQPAFDDQHAGFDLGLVARASRPRRQHRAVIMRCHLGIAAVDLGIVEAGLDHRDLGIVGHEQRRRAAERLERPHMRRDPVGQRLGPARLGIGQA